VITPRQSPMILLVKRLVLQRRLVAAVIALSIGATVLEAVGPRILAHATDLACHGVPGAGLSGGTKAGIDSAGIGRTLLLALGVYGLAASMMWAQTRVLRSAITHTLTSLRTTIEEKLHRLPLSYLDTCGRGDMLSRVTNDTVNIQEALMVVIGALPTAVVTVIAVLAMMLTMSPLLAGATVLTVPLCVFSTRVITRRARCLYSIQAANIGRLNTCIEEIYGGVELVQVFSRGAWAQDQFADYNADVRRCGVRAQFVSGLITPVATLVGNLGYVVVAIIGGLQMAAGHLSLGGIQAFIQYVRQFNQPISQVAGMYNVLLAGLASAQRVFDLLEAPEQECGTPPISPLADTDRMSGGTATGRVEFARVTFGYRPNAPVLKDLSVEAEPGSTVAIVGPTGAGKTTLINLLMRFYEVDAGRIRLDGRDITTFDQSYLRAQVGMVPQDSWVFAGSIADNIGYGRAGASRTAVIEAAAATQVDQFVRTLPNGYDTQLTEDGANLSAGQRQLITIARAFLADRQLLVLDEATSAVDTRTEVLIQRAMAALRRDRTCFVIAHRLSTIRDADLIVVMEAGRVVEQGSHAQLMACRGAYYAMIQAAAFDEAATLRCCFRK
jgi:ATP-binding cassette, subfamily B, fatty acid transporter